MDHWNFRITYTSLFDYSLNNQHSDWSSARYFFHIYLYSFVYHRYGTNLKAFLKFRELFFVYPLVNSSLMLMLWFWICYLISSYGFIRAYAEVIDSLCHDQPQVMILYDKKNFHILYCQSLLQYSSFSFWFPNCWCPAKMIWYKIRGYDVELLFRQNQIKFKLTM